MKRIAILGSTGSIGISALDVIKEFSGEFKAVALTTNCSHRLLLKQARSFRPALVCINDHRLALKLKSQAHFKAKVLTGKDGLRDIVRDKRIDMVLLAISGSAALMPLLEAIDAGRDIALANKEALVMAGSVIMERARRKKVNILPVDSEQSAIWQCLLGQEKKDLKNIYLTASGGPLRKRAAEDFKGISVREVLKHPRWKMGKKITVDSATLMNKGLELIEAMHLFSVVPEKIKILIHPEAVIHSMVEFVDGVILAQLSATDMRIPIQYALAYPRRLENRISPLDFFKLGSLNFEKPDFQKFPLLNLAYGAAEEGGTVPCVLNAANEVSVESFLKERIKFTGIARIVEKVIAKHRSIENPSLGEIIEADGWARREAGKYLAIAAS